MYYHKGTFYPSYPLYCIAYWSSQKRVHVQEESKHVQESKHNIKTSIFIDTTLSIVSIHAFFHPYSPRPMHNPRFLFTVTIPLHKKRI